MTRRQFLRAASVVGAGLLSGRAELPAIVPFARTGGAKMKLSLAAYSFRKHFAWMKGERQRVAGRVIDMREFIDLCAEHGCDGAELTSYFFPPGAPDDHLRQLRRHAFLRGVAISGTAVGNNFALPEGVAREREIAEVKRWIDKAALLGAPHVRVFAGSAGAADEGAARARCVAALQECCDHAGERGVFLGLENHGGIVAGADGMLAIIEAVESPWFGVSLDTGNFHTADPYGDLAKVAPYAVNVQLKVEMKPGGGEPEPVDLERVVGILREASYRGFVALEYEAAEDPFRAVPEWLGRLREAIG